MKERFVKMLQETEGVNSSRRLAFLTGHLFTAIGLFWICNELIEAKQYELAVDAFNSYLIYSIILGGYVTADIFLKIMQVLRGKK